MPPVPSSLAVLVLILWPRPQRMESQTGRSSPSRPASWATPRSLPKPSSTVPTAGEYPFSPPPIQKTNPDPLHPQVRDRLWRRRVHHLHLPRLAQQVLWTRCRLCLGHRLEHVRRPRGRPESQGLPQLQGAPWTPSHRLHDRRHLRRHAPGSQGHGLCRVLRLGDGGDCEEDRCRGEECELRGLGWEGGTGS